MADLAQQASVSRFLVKREGRAVRWVESVDVKTTRITWAKRPAEAGRYEASAHLDFVARAFGLMVVDIAQALDLAQGDL